MTYAQLLHAIPENLRCLYRQYENVSKKILNNKWSNEFNSICLTENILPNYSHIKHYDPAIRPTKCTRTYQRYLVEREMKRKQQVMRTLEEKQAQLLEEIELYDCSQELKQPVFSELCNILDNSDNVIKTRIVKKLNNLYHDCSIPNVNKSICLKQQTDAFINLSSYELSTDEREYLNLGLNCHIQPKYEKVKKQTNIEILYQNLLELESKKTIDMKQEIADRLRSEGTKHRNPRHTSILTDALKTAARNLKSNDDIVIRRADKSAVYVIMNKSEYVQKVNTLLDDPSKFKCISSNPTDQLKKKANKLIETVNAVQGDLKLSRIIGDYKPGYMYGNVKTHKQNYPLRPIISQIPTPTYSLAKSLNNIISRYVPGEYTVKSSNEFVDLLHSSHHNGIIGSLDVESLFTNVPIDKTIDVILKHVYNHPTITPPKIPSDLLRKLLELCTKEAPFRSPEGKMYLQIEGVAMGSPLGPTFANFYMGELEENIFRNVMEKPLIYVRYIDDIFVLVSGEDKLVQLRNTFQEHSVLKFTYELGVDGRLPFLDVQVNKSGTKFKTSVYHKPTDQGKCLNNKSECPDKYKLSVINNYLNRAYKISDSWSNFHHEVLHIKQVLVNNNYPNALVDTQLKKFLDRKLSNENNMQSKNLVPVYYESQMHDNYRLEERIIKNIVYDNTRCRDGESKLNLIFYYKNKKTSSLVMKNNMSPHPTLLQQSNVVYKFCCPLPHSQAVEYVGLTQTTLSRRLTCHAQDGGIYKHFTSCHISKPTRDQLTENTTIIARASDRFRLAVKEALYIIKLAPLINIQYDNFTSILKLYNHRNITTKANSENVSNTYPNMILPPRPNLALRKSPPNPTSSYQSLSSDPLSQTLSGISYPSCPQTLDLALHSNLTPSSQPSSPITSGTLNQGLPEYPITQSNPCVLENDCSFTSTTGIYENFHNMSSLPDMTKILLHFGIESSKLRTVPLKDYHWHNRNTCTPLVDLVSPTISQRIKSLDRGARRSKVKLTGEME